MTAQRRSRTSPRSRYTARSTPAAVESPPRGPQPGPPSDSTAMRPTERGPADAAVRGYARGTVEGLTAEGFTAEGSAAEGLSGGFNPVGKEPKAADGCATSIEGLRPPEGIPLVAGTGEKRAGRGAAAAGAMVSTRAAALSSRDASAESPWQRLSSCAPPAAQRWVCGVGAKHW